MSGIVNKVKEVLHTDKTHRHTEGTHGTHTTARTAAQTSTGAHEPGLQQSGGLHEASNLGTGTHEGAYATGDNRGPSGPASRTDGPHQSNILNKADPRVDSDRDYSRNMGANPERSAETGHHTTTGTHQTTLGTESGMHGATTGYNTRSTGHVGQDIPEGTHGPHSSRLANAADPRVDSDLDRRGQTGQTGTLGTTGGLGTTGQTGTLGGTTGSTLDPTGPARNTAGPHKSDMLNKADPRVDSDLDGSKTYGGDKTTTTGMLHRDPTDAAQVPPSVMQKHIGVPVVAHDDASHERERRHSTQNREHHMGL